MSWQIDFGHAHIYFTVRHMMISKVRGQFEKFSGTINFDPNNPTDTTVDISIDASSINTKLGQRDDHLRSPDFLNVEKYPQITFKSNRVEKIDDHNGKLYGDLTIRDVTNEVVLDVNYAGQAKSPWGTTSAGFSASTKINRTDWGLTWNQALETGGILVGEEVKIEIELELVKQAEEEAVAA
ncbi:MAG TPA: YceI family protein [Anaerolineae bacterium]|nr:YceI family protein [Anaerolineae bacterium]